MAQSIIVLKPAHFFSLDNDLIDVHAQTIGAIGVAVYAALARHLNRKTGAAIPAIGTIARKLGLARSTVKVYLHKLAQAGLIAISPRRDEAGDPTSHCYTLLPLEPAAVDEPPAEGGRPAADPPPTDCHLGGRPAADPKPSETPEPKQKNQAGDARAANPQPTPPPTDLFPALPERPDDCLRHLDPITLAQLDTAAHHALVDAGVAPHFCIRPVIESTMVRLWLDQQAAAQEAPPLPAVA